MFPQYSIMLTKYLECVITDDFVSDYLYPGNSEVCHNYLRGKLKINFRMFQILM